jgi:outer membrane protein assembly factor BamB
VFRALTSISCAVQVRKPFLLGSIALALAVTGGATAALAAAPTVPASPAPLFPLELRALVPLGAPPLDAPTSDGHLVFVPLRPATLLAVSLTTGTVAWRSELGIVHAPVVGSGKLFVLTQDTLEALDATTGAASWRLPLAAAPAAAPTVTPDLVFVALASGELMAATPADGTVAWRVGVGGAPRGQPQVLGDRVLVALDDGRVVSLSRTSGAKMWEQRLAGAVTGLAGAKDNVYAGSLDNFFYCLDAASGRIKWRWRTGGDLVGTASVDDERVYFVSMDNIIRALDRRTGVQKWTKPLAGRPVVGPLRVGDTLLLPSLSSELRGVKAESGDAAGRYDMGSELGAALVFAPGTWAAEDQLIAVSTDGTLLVLGRRLSLGVAPLTALPGVPTDITASPPPQDPQG